MTRAKSLSVSECFARRLPAARAARGLSQRRLAQDLRAAGLGIDHSALARIESGARNVSLDEAFAIALALNVSPLSMFAPREPAPRVRIAPSVDMAPGDLRRWVRGLAPARPGDKWRRPYFEEVSDEEWEAHEAFPELRRIADQVAAIESFATAPRAAGEEVVGVALAAIANAVKQMQGRLATKQGSRRGAH